MCRNRCYLFEPTLHGPCRRDGATRDGVGVDRIGKLIDGRCGGRYSRLDECEC